MEKREVGLKKTKPHLQWNSLCASKGGSICLFLVKLIKEILCQVENRRSAAFTGGRELEKVFLLTMEFSLCLLQ